MSSAILENAAGGLIASGVHEVVRWLLSRISAEIKLAWGFQKQLQELEGQFTRLSWLLQGASGMPITSPMMANWLKKINDVAEDVDDLLDEWSYKALQHRIQTRKRDKFIRTFSQPLYRQVMAHKVKDIRKLIGSIYHDATAELGIKPIKVAGGEVYSGIDSRKIEKLSNLRERVDLDIFQGRDHDVEELVKKLCNPNNTNSHLTVIGIVGLAGLGKTAISKHISMKKEVTDFFNPLVIWLVVSHNFDLKELLNQMFEKVFGKPAKMKGQGLIDQLQSKMKGEKYLIILDDVWDTLEWDPLIFSLQEIGVSQGTTLLVTSRERIVVEKLRTHERPTIHLLEKLSPDDSWSLFLAKYNDEIVVGSEKEDLAKRMINKCGGVPLAIRALADLLWDKSIEEWREIKESELWATSDENGILPSLRLSYNYLEGIALKKCFAFCANFKEDAVIKEYELIYMWMAQGLLQPNEKMERTGEDYIKRLLSCSLFQEAKMDKFGGVETFKMHDLVLTLARDVANGECLYVCSEKWNVKSEVRQVSIHSDIESGELHSKSFIKLRTCLLGMGDWVSYSVHFWLTCKHLRVLNVGRQVCKNVDWKPLGSLIHLRYFAIIGKDHEDFMQSNLPNQILKLYHLQTLSINYDITKYVPPVAPFLKKIRNLVNLRHVIINHCMGIPVGLSHLKVVQFLPIIKLGLNWGGNISELGLLTNLTDLEIHSLTLLSVEEARSLSLGSKSNLDCLVMEWEDYDIYDDNRSIVDNENPKANEILEALQPNESLQKLELRDFDGTAFPKWLMGPKSPLINIVFLELWYCGEAEGNLIVENFICLRILDVVRCQKLTITFPNKRSQRYCNLLEELKIIDCEKVELLDLSLFPQLRDIWITYNESTNRDNVLVGLSSLRSLRKLYTDLQVPADLGEESPVCKSLENLTLVGSENNADKTYLPEQLQHLVALRDLWLSNLKSVEAIPNWVGKLSSLQKLTVVGMPKLKHLPPQGVWKSLSNLTSFDCRYHCPLLQKDIKNITGEWFKIAHIPDICPKKL